MLSRTARSSIRQPRYTAALFSASWLFSCLERKKQRRGSLPLGLDDALALEEGAGAGKGGALRKPQAHGILASINKRTTLFALIECTRRLQCSKKRWLQCKRKPRKIRTVRTQINVPPPPHTQTLFHFPHHIHRHYIVQVPPHTPPPDDITHTPSTLTLDVSRLSLSIP